MLWQILSQIGLTEKEAKIYLALLETGNQAASVIAKKSGVNRTTCYMILTELKDKGLITTSNIGSTQYFQALDPTFLLTYIQKEKNKLAIQENMLEQNMRYLEKIQAKNTNKPKVTFYEGETGILNLYLDTLQSKEKKICSFLNYFAVPEKLYKKLETDYLPQRVKLDIEAKIITISKQQINTKGNILTSAEEKLREIKYYTSDLELEVEIQTYDNKTSIINFKKDNLFGVLIENQELANSIKNLHKIIWQFI
ncbi:hypothetical protein HOH51_02155 [bacterium]|jgi:HTH-type transcriptional regulator, sugar sensing transcriptional regulator|nr:hypothetical protein [bacterium]